MKLARAGHFSPPRRPSHLLSMRVPAVALSQTGSHKRDTEYANPCRILNPWTAQIPPPIHAMTVYMSALPLVLQHRPLAIFPRPSLPIQSLLNRSSSGRGFHDSPPLPVWARSRLGQFPFVGSAPPVPLDLELSPATT